jgi:chromate transport protein ChrA
MSPSQLYIKCNILAGIVVILVIMGVFDKSRHIRWLRSFTLEIGASILGLSLSAIRILFAPTEWAPSSAVPWQL